MVSGQFDSARGTTIITNFKTQTYEQRTDF